MPFLQNGISLSPELNQFTKKILTLFPQKGRPCSAQKQTHSKSDFITLVLRVICSSRSLLSMEEIVRVGAEQESLKAIMRLDDTDCAHGGP